MIAFYFGVHILFAGISFKKLEFVLEAQGAENNKDFIYKLSVSQKECDETLYWLELPGLSEYLSEEVYKSTNAPCVEVMKMLISAITTSERKLLG